MSSSIRAIVFDAVGTLIHPVPPAAVVYAEVGNAHGSRYKVEDIARRFAGAFAAEENTDRAGPLHTSEKRERQRWQTIVARVLDDVNDPETCFEILYRHFARPEAWRCQAGADLLLGELARRGYVLGLASNYDGRLRAVVAGMETLRMIPHLVISSEVGWRKPAPAFFAALGRAVSLPAANILHVGDDRANDFDGAIAAGLQAVLLDPNRKHLDLGQRRLEKLADLRQWLPGK